MAAAFLILVTLLSLAIRHVRSKMARAGASARDIAAHNSQSTAVSKDTALRDRNPNGAAVHDAEFEEPDEFEEFLYWIAIQEQRLLEDASYILDTETGLQHDKSQSPERANVVSIEKSFEADYSKFKDDYAKSKGSKGLQKISISEYENVYITDKGEHWYVAENPDGTITKTQLKEIDGQLQPAGEARVYQFKK